MRARLLPLLLLFPGAAAADLSTRSPSGSTGSGWTSPSSFDGATAGAATYSIPAIDGSTYCGDGTMGFDSVIPDGSTISQVRSRIYWESSTCTDGGVTADWQLAVSGTPKGGTPSETCKASAGWSPWHTHTGTWTRADLLDGILTFQAAGANTHATTARTMSLYAGEVEVTYTPPGATRPHVGMWSVLFPRNTQPRGEREP